MFIAVAAYTLRAGTSVLMPLPPPHFGLDAYPAATVEGGLDCTVDALWDEVNE